MDWFLVEEILKNKKSVSITVRGTSMYPTLFSGDQVTLIPYDKKIHPGDIILVRPKDQFLLHRLVEKKEGLYYTKGDNVSDQDPPSVEIIATLCHQKKTILSRLKRLKYQLFLKFSSL